jgi:predicted glutamine amidotransferase
MCLIWTRHAKRADCDISELDWKAAVERNGDGIGVMYPVKDKKGNPSLFTDKVNGDAKLLQDFYKEHNAKSRENFGVLATHLRKETKGGISLDNCHPHKVLSKDNGDPVDLYMMHNGTIQNFGSKDVSDSAEFAEKIRPMLVKKPSLLKDKFFIDMLNSFINKGQANYNNSQYSNKLVFMDGIGQMYYVNQGVGKVKDGLWYSNDYSLHKEQSVTKGSNTSSTVGKTNYFQTQVQQKHITQTKQIGNSQKTGTHGSVVSASDKELFKKCPQWMKNRHGNIRETHKELFNNIKPMLEKEVAINWESFQKSFNTQQKKSETKVPKRQSSVYVSKADPVTMLGLNDELQATLELSEIDKKVDEIIEDGMGRSKSISTFNASETILVKLLEVVAGLEVYDIADLCERDSDTMAELFMYMLLFIKEV